MNFLIGLSLQSLRKSKLRTTRLWPWTQAKCKAVFDSESSSWTANVSLSKISLQILEKIHFVIVIVLLRASVCLARR